MVIHSNWLLDKSSFLRVVFFINPSHTHLVPSGPMSFPTTINNYQKIILTYVEQKTFNPNLNE